MQPTSTDTLRRFLATLLDKQIRIDGEERQDPSLVYANAVLAHAAIVAAHPELPPQIVLIGPTQAGKSTVVNLLLGGESAVANALAGFTRHAQGFCTGPIDDELTATIDRLLQGLHRVEPERLDPDALDRYALVEAPNGDPIARPAVVWDTPDFDSVSSRDYRFGVPRLCAIADLIVLVVSKEKYADQSVWETLRLIDQLPHPLAICINKSSAHSDAQIREAMAKKLEQEGIEHGAITTLPYEPDFDLGKMIASPDGQALRDSARSLLPAQRPAPDNAKLKQFLQNHWLQWTAPLRREVNAGKAWQRMLDDGFAQAEQRYQTHYLRDPHYSDTMQRAIVKLMDLLELPGVAGHIGRVRNAISWPARTLIDRFVNRDQPNNSGGQTLSLEDRTLTELSTDLLTTLQRQIGDHSASDDADLRPWWQQLWLQLQQESAALNQLVEQQIQAHQRAFEPKIEAAAEDLYHYLEQHPTTLNSLRAARVTADVGALVLALKTGGIGLNDLILAPAMLTFTSMLTEGAVGRYMARVEEDLKRAQLESVREHIFDPLRARLEALPAQLDANTIYGIDEATLIAAEQELTRL